MTFEKNLPFGGSFGGLCSRWLLLLIGEDEMGNGFGGLGSVGEAVPKKNYVKMNKKRSKLDNFKG